MAEQVTREQVVGELVAMSHELGRESLQLAILGEGNTSARCDEQSFLVKGSGSQLASIRGEQFSQVRYAPVLELLERPEAGSAEVEQVLRTSLCDAKAPRPSIETMLHALCLQEGGAKFVGHTHAEACNQILCSQHGATPFLRHIFPDAIVVCGRAPLVVPYVDPGLPLALAFRQSLRQYLAEHGRGPKLALLINHGIIALGQTSREVLNITLMAQKWARILVGSMLLGGASYLSDQSLAAIDSRPDEEYRRRMLSASAGQAPAR